MIEACLPANTSVQRGVYGIMRPAVQRRIRDTLNKAKTLSRYVRDSKAGEFMSTGDVAMTDCMTGLVSEASLRQRLLSSADMIQYMSGYGCRG